MRVEQDPVPIDDSIEASQLHTLPRAREPAGFVAKLPREHDIYLDNLLVPWYTVASAPPSSAASLFKARGCRPLVQ